MERSAANMRELEAQVKTCQLCRLSKTRTQAVPGEGNTRTEVMFIGEGPGYHEDKQGRPFVGAAGQFLNELLGISGLERDAVFITNVVKCRPPNNRDPLPDETAACAPYLERQIALINPRVIVTLGRHSMTMFFPGERISQIHGTARMVDGRMCVAMYHPAAGLHQASLADIIRADFRKLPVYLEQSRKVASPPAKVVEERIEVAVEARESVVHEAETGTVLDAPTPVELAPAEEMPEQAQAAEQAEPEAAKPLTRTRAKRATKASEYKQMSLFEL
ncbi:MAG TPA: uracil-DNA glycosylase [Chloroflexia bacterium]|nr:uracil-DNA glycosylase [Chloroflexia bacterium]